MKPVLMARVALLLPFGLGIFGSLLLSLFGIIGQTIFGFVAPVLFLMAIIRIAKLYQQPDISKWAVASFITQCINTIIGLFGMFQITNAIITKFGDGSTTEFAVFFEQFKTDHAGDKDKMMELLMFGLYETTLIPVAISVLAVSLVGIFFQRFMYVALTNVTGVAKFNSGSFWILIGGFTFPIFGLGLIPVLVGFIFLVVGFFELTDEQVEKASKIQ